MTKVVLQGNTVLPQVRPLTPLTKLSAIEY